MLKYPDPILLTKAAPVFDWVQGMATAMQLEQEIAGVTWGECAGMAAPQIGISQRVFIAMGRIFINPKIIDYSPQMQVYREGCYSLEDNKFDYKVRRADWIDVVWRDEDWHPVRRRFTGAIARIIQHEYDHLEGRLCNTGILEPELEVRNHNPQYREQPQ